MYEWDFDKNSAMNAATMSYSSHTKVWWICGSGHGWEAKINNRAIRGDGCPICNNRQLLSGYNDLYTTHPDVAIEWNDSKNTLPPNQVFAGSSSKYWWKCSKGHEWEATPLMRCFRDKTNCPYCSNRKIIVGYNDLLTTHPALAKEWDLKKNGYPPTSVVGGSHKKPWWVCENNHSWSTPVYRRTLNGSGCPYCANQLVLEGYNDFLTTHPDLAKEWDTGKNKWSPNEVHAGSNKKVWWKCDQGHGWETSLHKRTQRLTGCHTCTNRKVLAGFNDLETTRPDLALQWDHDLNTILPSEVVAGSNKKVWWKCDLGHSWESTLNSRSTNGNGCPICSNLQVLKGYNDLLHVFPDVAREWDYEKNDHSPDSIVYGSRKPAWWKCVNGHEWKTLITHRTRGTSCPKCCTKQTSGSEKRLRTFLTANGLEMVNTTHGHRVPVAWRNHKFMEIDLEFTMNGRKIALEYDGSYFHRSKESVGRDKDKTLALLADGYLVVRVREQSNSYSLDLLEIDDSNLFQVKSKYSTKDDHLIDAVEKIKQWLDEKTANGVR